MPNAEGHSTMTSTTRGSSLAEFFLEWQQAGYSVSDMKAFLDQRIRHGVITVVPSLPASWHLRLMGASKNDAFST